MTPTKICQQCGAEFRHTKGQSAVKWTQRKFCSRRCVGLHNIPVRNNGHARAAGERLQSRLEDVTFLLACGESPHGVAERLGVSAKSVARYMWRHGYGDIAKTFERAAA